MPHLTEQCPPAEQCPPTEQCPNNRVPPHLVSCSFFLLVFTCFCPLSCSSLVLPRSLWMKSLQGNNNTAAGIELATFRLTHLQLPHGGSVTSWAKATSWVVTQSPSPFGGPKVQTNKPASCSVIFLGVLNYLSSPEKSAEMCLYHRAEIRPLFLCFNSLSWLRKSPRLLFLPGRAVPRSGTWSPRSRPSTRISNSRAARTCCLLYCRSNLKIVLKFSSKFSSENFVFCHAVWFRWLSPLSFASRVGVLKDSVYFSKIFPASFPGLGLFDFSRFLTLAYETYSFSKVSRLTTLLTLPRLPVAAVCPLLSFPCHCHRRYYLPIHLMSSQIIQERHVIVISTVCLANHWHFEPWTANSPLYFKRFLPSFTLPFFDPINRRNGF